MTVRVRRRAVVAAVAGIAVWMPVVGSAGPPSTGSRPQSGSLAVARAAPSAWVMTGLGHYWAQDINERGQIVVLGPAYSGRSRWRSYVRSNGRMRDLGTLSLGAADAPNATTSGGAMNERGEIIGAVLVNRDDSFSFHAFHWYRGKMSDLGCGQRTRTRCHNISSRAYALNEHGQSVGLVGHWHGGDDDSSASDAAAQGNDAVPRDAARRRVERGDRDQRARRDHRHQLRAGKARHIRRTTT